MNSAARDFGIGKHRSFLQTPWGFSSKRVARLRSGVLIQSWPESCSARAIAVALSSQMMVAGDCLACAGNDPRKNNRESKAGVSLKVTSDPSNRAKV